VQQALEGLPGVKRAEVSFAKRQAIVQYDMGKVDAAQMVTAIKRLGFSARLQQ
jgi:copper chaperone CopZ